MTYMDLINRRERGDSRAFFSILVIFFIINISPFAVNSHDNGSVGLGSESIFDLTTNANKVHSRANTSSDSWVTYMAEPSHNGNSTSISPDKNGILWQTNTEYDVFSSPTVKDGRVYFGDNGGYLYSLYIDDGSEIWKEHISKYSYQGGGGDIWSSLTIDDGNLYFGCHDYNVYAITADDAEKIWQYNTTGQVLGTPVVVGDVVYVASTKGFTKVNGTLFALDKSTGSLLWYFNTTESISTTPAISGNSVFIGSQDNKFYALNAQTGAEQWNFTTGGEIKSSAAVDQGIVYFGSTDNKLYAVDAQTGAQKWNKSLDGLVESSPAVADDLVFITTKKDTDGSIYAFDKVSSAQRWRSTIPRSDSTPAVAEGRVFFYATNYVYAYDIATGAMEWEKEIPNGEIHSSPAIAEGMVFLGVSSGGQGMMTAFGTPDFNMDASSVSISEPEPFLGEYITLSTEIDNRGTVGGAANVTFSYASAGGSISGDIGFEVIQLQPRSKLTVNIEWQVLENPLPDEQLWVIWFNITDLQYQVGGSDYSQSKSLSYHLRDLSGWQMFQGNFEHSGYAPGGAASNIVIWENLTKNPGAVPGSIILGNSRVYAATSGGRIQSFNEITGQPLQDYGVPGTVVSEPTLFIGDDTTTHDSIIIATREGIIYSIDSTTTNHRWSYDIGSAVYSTPIIYNGLVIMGAMDGYMYALDMDAFTDGDQGIDDVTPPAGSGDLVWKTNLDSLIGSSKAAVSTTQDSIYIGTLGGKLVALDPGSGAINWTYTTGGAIQSTPSIIGDLIIVGSNDTKLYAFDLRGFSNGDGGITDANTDKTQGDLIWATALGSAIGVSSPAANPAGSLVYVGTFGGDLHAVETATGDSNWSYSIGASIMSSPAVGTSAVYVTASDGNLYALELEMIGSASEFEPLWNFSGKSNSKITSSPAILGSRIFCADENGWVYALGAPNMVPNAIISSPENGTAYFESEDILFDASNSFDLDDTELYYMWTAKNIVTFEVIPLYSGSESSFTTNINKGGNYIITLTVSDPLRYKGTAVVNVTIFADEDDVIFTKQRVAEFCEISIPACTVIKLGGPGQVIMSSVSNPGSPSDLNLSVNKFVSFTFVEVPGEIYRINWTNVSIGFSSSDVQFNMNISRIQMYYWDSSWISISESGVTRLADNDIEVWANVSGILGVTPVIFAPGTFDNTPPVIVEPIDGALIAPISGREVDVFTFRALYRDIDSDSARDGGWVLVYLDGIAHPMSEENPGSANYGTYVGYILTRSGREIGVGTHTISFAAHDGTIRSLELLTSDLDLVVTASAPVANAGSDIRVEAGKTFNLDASGSTDPDGSITAYYWDLNTAVDADGDGDPTNDRDEEGMKVGWKFDTPGIYTVTLTVVDDSGSEDVDTITVTVVPSTVDEDDSDLGTALRVLAIGLLIIILAIIVGFMFLWLKRREEDEMDRIYAGALPVRKVKVTKLKRRRIGEEEEDEDEEEDEEDGERVAWEGSEDQEEDEEAEDEDSEDEDEDDMEMEEAEDEGYGEDYEDEEDEDEDDDDDDDEEMSDENIECPSCGKVVAPDDYKCSACGFELDEMLDD